VWGFHAPWDRRSATSVAQHGAQLAVIVSGWMTLDSISGLPALRYRDTLTVPRHTSRFALVTTYAGTGFHPELVRHLATDSAQLGRVAGAIAAQATAGRYRGLVLDLEGQTPADTAALSTILRTVVDSAHRHGIAPVTVAVAPADSVAYAPRVLRHADLLLVMLYDQHWATSSAGPIVSAQWFAPLLAWWVDRAGAARIVAGLPTYGYAWRRGAAAAVVSYADAVQLASRMGVSLARDTISGMPHLVRPDSVDVWVSDAPLLATLTGLVKRSGVHRIALWRLGLEDPAIWGPAGIVPR
jgi:spore germination protein YaaH